MNNKQLTINGEQVSYGNQEVMNNRELFDQDVQKNGKDFFQDHLRIRSGWRKILSHSFAGEPVPYILFIGRLEERKNIVRCIEAFAMTKEKYHIPHILVLAGKPGYGYDRIKNFKSKIRYAEDIVELGYVSEEEKWALLRKADIFFFATLYEGFGIPALEAQSAGVPVITSNTSSLPEVAGEGAILVDPTSVEAIAEAMQSLISNQTLKSAILQKGTENVRRFSWEKCAQEIGVLLKSR